MQEGAIHTDIEVLREMVRLAEARRTEMVEGLERVNRYNLALIAFAAGFMSVLVTAPFEKIIVQISGALLLLSVSFSLLAVRPKTLKGVTLAIDEDVAMVKKGHMLDMREYLLLTAELTDAAATYLNAHSAQKKLLTISSASFIALSLLVTYALYAYA